MRGSRCIGWRRRTGLEFLIPRITIQAQQANDNTNQDSSLDRRQTVNVLILFGNSFTRPGDAHRTWSALLVCRQREFNQLINLGRLIAVVKGADVGEHLLCTGAGSDKPIPFFAIPERNFPLGAHLGFPVSVAMILLHPAFSLPWHTGFKKLLIGSIITVLLCTIPDID